jgi:hypothetical protein
MFGLENFEIKWPVCQPSAVLTNLGPQLKTPTVFTCTQIFVITHFIYFFLPYLHQMLFLALFRTAIFYGV